MRSVLDGTYRRLEQVGGIQDHDDRAGAEHRCAAHVAYVYKRGAQRFDDQLRFVDESIGQDGDRPFPLWKYEEWPPAVCGVGSCRWLPQHFRQLDNGYDAAVDLEPQSALEAMQLAGANASGSFDARRRHRVGVATVFDQQ